MRLPSRHEAFINDKTEWISDKFFTQQRFAGPNPMSLKRVTIHGKGKLVCILLYTTTRIFALGDEEWSGKL